MKKLLILLISIFLSTVLFACSSSNATDNNETNEEDKPTLTFGVANWTSTVPPTEIAKRILKDMGYNIEEINADVGNVYTGIDAGDVDIFMDSWYPGQKQYYERYSDNMEKISTNYDNADSGMVVPKYMEDINSVEDLKGNEDIVDNEMLAIGEGDPAMQNMEKPIDSYDLNIEMTNSSEAAMLAAAKPKIEKEEPVLLYGWRPHSMFNKYNLKILTNEDAPGDMFSGSSVNVVANKNLKEKAPEAYEFLSNWSISIDDMEEMIAEIDEEDSDEIAGEVAQNWIDNHQDKIEEMKGD